MRKIVGILCLMLAALMLTGSLSVCADGTDRETEITSVRVSENGEKLIITATVSDYYIKRLNGRLLSLYEFYPSAMQADIEGAVPVTSGIPAETMTFELDLKEADPQRKYSKFILGYTKGKKNTLLGNVAYIDDPENISQSAIESPKAQSLIGMMPVSDIPSESIGHGVVPVYVNQLFADTADGSVRYEYGENVYYLDKEVLSRLDARVDSLALEGRRVYLQLLLAAPDDTSAVLTNSLYSSKEQGRYYAPNTADPQGVRLWSSLTEFLCRRYTDTDGGRVAAFILGDNINEKGNFLSAATDLDTYVYDLARTIRVTSTAIRSSCDGVKLYVDFDGRFSGSHDDAYTIREIFSELFSVKQSKAHNNLCEIPFGIYLDVSTDEVKFWEEEGVAADFSTPKITPANIDFFIAYLRDNPTLLYNGKARELMISYSIETDNAKDQQLATLASVYRAMSCKGIDAFIYDTAIDAAGAEDSVLYSELCTAAKSDISVVGERIKSLLTRGEYEALAGTVLSGIFVKRDTLPLYTDQIPSEERAEHIADFSDGDMHSFSVSKDVNTHGITTDSIGNILRLTGVGNMVGASRSFEKGKDLFSKNVMTLSLKPETADGTAYLTLILKGTKDGIETSLSSTVELRPNEWNTVAFDTSGLDMLWKMSFEVEGSEESALTVYVRKVTLFTDEWGLDGTVIRIAFILLIVALVFFVILLVILIRMRVKKNARAKIGNRYKVRRKDNWTIERVNVGEAHPRKSVAAPEQKREPKEEKAIPVMPKSEKKTFVVPAKQSEPIKRKTMDLGIEPISKETHIDIDKTQGE